MIEVFQKIRFRENRMDALFSYQSENATEEETLRWTDIEADRNVQTAIVDNDMDAALQIDDTNVISNAGGVGAFGSGEVSDEV